MIYWRLFLVQADEIEAWWDARRQERLAYARSLKATQNTLSEEEREDLFSRLEI